MPRAKRKLAAGKITAADAAKVLHITTSGVYAALKRGDIKGGRTKDGKRVVVWIDRQSAKDYRAATLKWLKDSARIKAGRLTDAEFIQRMWDNDPDD